MADSEARSALGWLRARQDRLVERLATLVAVPSHASQPDGIARMAQLMGIELAEVEFEPAVAPAAAHGRAPAWAERILSPDVPFEDLPAPSVWRRGGSATRVLVLGDLDAALPQPPEACRLAIQDGRAIGPAVADMKGGLVVLVAALEALRETRHPSPTLTIMLSGDEQAGSLRSRGVIAALAAEADWVVCVECARDGGRLMGSRAHIGVGRLVARGKEAHAGTARGAGVNAIGGLARALVALEADGVSRTDAFVTATMLVAGRRRSVLPGEARAVLDLRARDAVAWNSLETRLRVALEDAGLADDVTLDSYSHRPGLARTTATNLFLELVRGVGAEIGLAIDAVGSMAAGSSAFADSGRVPVLDGLGPAGGALMTPQEYVEIDTIPERAALLAGTLAAIAELPVGIGDQFAAHDDRLR